MAGVTGTCPHRAQDILSAALLDVRAEDNVGNGNSVPYAHSELKLEVEGRGPVRGLPLN